MNGGDAAENDFGRTINGDDRENEEIDEEDEEQEKDYDQFNNLNSQDEDEEEEAELRPKLAEGFYEIEAVRRKRVRKGQVQYLIKWRGWPETANTWEPYENLVSCFDVIEAFEEGLRSGKHRSRKRKRRSSGLVPQAKKKTQGTPGASTSSAPAAGNVKFDEGSFVIPFVGDVIHENGGRSGVGDIGNDDAIEQGNGNENGNGSVAIPPQVEEGRDQNEMDVNLGEYTCTPCTSRGSNRLAIDILGSETSEAVCFENGHEKVVGQGLVQANGRLRNRRKPASVKRFIQKQTSDVIHENGGRSGMGDIGNDDAIEQGNGNGSIAIPPQVENGRDQYGMDVNLGGYTGTPFASGGSNRLAIDSLGSETAETICFENRHEKVDGEGLVQANGRLRNRRKPASVKRFIHENGGRSGMGDIGNDDAMEQGNGNGSIAIPPQVEEGRDQYEMNVNLGGCTGTSFASGGSNRLAIDILESETSEAICFENGHEKVDGEALVQAGRLRNRRKPASVKRFNHEQGPCVTNYAAQDLTTKNTRASGIAGQNWDKNSGYGSKSDNITNTFPITEIIKPISFSSSGFVPDIVLTFMAKRSDGKEVMVDNKYLKANYPLLLINYYEQHLNYNATAGPDRSGIGCMAG